jgi:hypothetical protein
MTSLYQATIRRQVVETVTPKNKRVKRWFYIDIRRALDPAVEREDAIMGVGEDRTVREDFGRSIVLDLSSAEKEFGELMFPVTDVFDWDGWQDGFDEHWCGEPGEPMRRLFRRFKNEVLQNFKSYRVPVIALDRRPRKRLSVWCSRK